MVDMVYFLVAGYASSFSGNNSGYLWPHMSILYDSTNHVFCVPHSNILSKDEIEEIFSSLDVVDAEMGLSEQSGLTEKLSENIITYDASRNMLIEKNGVSYFPEINALSGNEQSADMARNPVHR